MPGTASRRTSAVLALTFGAGAVVAAAFGAPGAWADVPNSAPEASYRLSSYSLYTGQSTTLIQQSLTDDTSAAADISQVIDWADGTTQTVSGTTTAIAHTYAVAGSYAPRVVVSDGTDQRPGGKETPGYVTVSAPMGGFKLDRTSVWVGDAVTLVHHTSDDMTSVRIWWGDGTTSTVTATIAESRAKHYYRVAGTYLVKAAALNANGTTTARSAGTVAARLDTSRPAVSLTRPAGPTKATSWATVRGKSSDTGRGVATVALTAVEKRGSSWYYYTGSAWKKATSYAAAGTKAKARTVAAAGSGAWSAQFTGVAQGKLLIKYRARDRAGNTSALLKVEQTITR